MNFHMDTAQAAHPVTTTTNCTTTTTTTAATLSTRPIMTSQPAGWHAKTLGFDWNKRAEHRQYLLKTGLPEIHAAVINDDWDAAADMLSPEDIGLVWLTPESQRHGSTIDTVPQPSSWAAALPSRDESRQRCAIIDMAVDRFTKTSIEGAGCLHGSNLLTLCLEKKAPAAFMEKLIAMTKKYAPQYLSNPDANGRTPLYAAIELGNEKAVQMLLKAGADQYVQCSFLQNKRPDHGPSAYDLAFTKGSVEIFELMLGKKLELVAYPGRYPVNQDPLKLADWVARNEENDVKQLAAKFDVLQFGLFCFPDKSGTSLYNRHIENNIGFEIDMQSLLISDPKNNPLCQSAAKGLPRQFSHLLKYFLDEFQGPGQKMLMGNALQIFLLNRPTSEINALLEDLPEAAPHFHRTLVQVIEQGFVIPFEKFKELTLNAWPALQDQQKIKILINTARYEDRHREFIAQILDCPITNPEKVFSQMSSIAFAHKNVHAYKYAEDRALYTNYLFDFARKGKINPDFVWALGDIMIIRSKRMFDDFMKACPSLQPYITNFGQHLLPMLADYDPAGLPERLRGMTYQIGEAEINNAKTEAGRQILRELMNKPAT